METTGDPRLPNKLQADLWAFSDNMSAARKCSISLCAARTACFSTINPFSPELSTERPRLKNRRRTGPNRDSITP